jgi:DNA gyrase subunit A
VRTSVGEISILGRNTQGVTLIRLRQEEKLVGLERIQPEEEEAGEGAEGEAGE